MVVVGSPDSPECFCVPCFTPGRKTIEALIRELEDSGWQRDEIVVRINNAEHVQFKAGFPVNEESEYCLWHRQPHSVSTIKASRWIGEMNEAGVVKIARGLLKMEERCNHSLSPKLKKKITQWLRKVAPEH